MHVDRIKYKVYAVWVEDNFKLLIGTLYNNILLKYFAAKC